TPILLLDDVFDKLDIERVSKIIALVSGPEYGQIFITDSNDARLHDIVRGLNSEYLLYTAKDGTYTRN
ncbi:MAG: DNA replication and repair protein RecF, partial [Bacteroidales bacterium]|nr:DNA replication and repair protein RecF [Bacteroidales bacterium]